MTNKKRDFRNIKSTQFDAAQTAKMEFSELHSAKRVLHTNNILKDGYTHFKQVLDGNNRPTNVTYYQATDSTIDRLTFRAICQHYFLILGSLILAVVSTMKANILYVLVFMNLFNFLLSYSSTVNSTYFPSIANRGLNIRRPITITATICCNQGYCTSKKVN